MAVFGVTVDIDLERGEAAELKRLYTALQLIGHLGIVKCFRVNVSWNEWMVAEGRTLYGKAVKMMARDCPVMPVLCCSPLMGDKLKPDGGIPPELAAAFVNDVLTSWSPYLDDYVELRNSAPLGLQWSGVLSEMAVVARGKRKKVVLGARHGSSPSEFVGIGKILDRVDAFGLWWSQWKIEGLRELRQDKDMRGEFWVTETEVFAHEEVKTRYNRLKNLLQTDPPRMFWHRLQDREGEEGEGLLDVRGKLTPLCDVLEGAGTPFRRHVDNFGGSPHYF